MKRTILALAIAGLSVAAYASPPPGGGPPTPIDVNVVRTVMPFPYVTNLKVSKVSGDQGSSSCLTIPDSFAQLRISGLHVDGNFTPTGSGPFRYDVTLIRGEQTFNIYFGLVETDDIYNLWPSPLNGFSDHALFDFWTMPGDQICTSISSQAGTTVLAYINFNMTIMGEGY